MGGKPAPVWSSIAENEQEPSSDRWARCSFAARCFVLGLGASDESRAVRLWKSNADAYEPFSVFCLGIATENANLIEKAAEMGFSEAYAEAAKICGNSAKSRKYLEKGSAEKVWICKFRLSELVDDKKEAFKLLRESVEHGEEDALFSLANAYFEGSGVEQDRLTAAKHFESAAKYLESCAKHVDGGAKHLESSLEALYRAAMCYILEKRGEKAVKLLKKAARKGHKKACYRLALAMLAGEFGLNRDDASKIEQLMNNAGEEADLYRKEGEAKALEMLKSIEAPKKLCSFCRKPGDLKKCGKCKSSAYCSVECQKEDWTLHKVVCAKK